MEEKFETKNYSHMYNAFEEMLRLIVSENKSFSKAEINAPTYTAEITITFKEV